tara:strand:- start:1389 stop:1637 length:249 start_codon:yes stop_codon:yes gene_type:complete
MEHIYIRISVPFLKVLTIGLIVLAFSLSACEDIRVGKSRAELAQEQWRTDSLIKTIHYQMDSVAMDFNRLYIDAKRINNGSN